jgi:hypothetical protein
MVNLNDEKFNDLYCSLNIVSVIKSMTKVGIARSTHGARRVAYRVVVSNLRKEATWETLA